jgi:hypothetical protein
MNANSDEMRAAFWEQARQMIACAPHGSPMPFIGHAGAELELVLWDPHTQRLASDTVKNEILAQLGPDFGVELGAACVEVHPGPVHLPTAKFTGWMEQLSMLEDRLAALAQERGLEVGRWGSVPFADTRDVERTGVLRYKLVPDFHNNHRSDGKVPRIAGLPLDDAGVVGVLNSFQFSLQAQTVEAAVDMMNRLFMISPWAVALFANASCLGGKNTGWADCRFEVWRRSHDTRTFWQKMRGDQLRIGLPNRFFSDVDDYLKDVAQFPFILDNPEAALKIGIGLYWRDVRLKFAECAGVGVVPLVEFRPLSIQPTLKGDILASAFVIGRLMWSQLNQERLPDMESVRVKKYLAEKFGKKGFNAKDLRVEVERAIEGLEAAGLMPTRNLGAFDLRRDLLRLLP